MRAHFRVNYCVSIALALLMLGVCSPISVADMFIVIPPLEVEGARLSAHADKVRFVLELSTASPYKVTQLSHPERLVIDIPNAKLQTNLEDILIKTKVIHTIRTAKHPGYVRVVIDLNQSVILKNFTLKPEGQYGYRLVFDLYPKEKSSAKPALASTLALLSEPSPVLVAAPQYYQRDIVVIIDAGHGGKDSGALGPRGTKEKQVVLNVARKLQNLLDKQPGIKSVLTRDGDYYIALRERLARAREYKADIFISIHADAFNNSKSHGASVYALSQRGASSEAARWLATKENHSELGEVNLVDKEDLVREVLINLSQQVSSAQSLALGETILRSLSPIAKLHYNHVEQAQFVVLKSPDIPSILIETGFISNPQEENLLRNSVYQVKLAHAIWQGLRTHCLNSPPEGTYLAYVKQRKKTHVVKKGENLDKLAWEYGTTVSALKKANLLSSDILKINQALNIPISMIG